MLEIEKELVQLISAKADLRVIILFGSTARGDENEESDIDLAVLFQKPMSAEIRMKIIEETALVCGRPIDLVDLSTVGEPLLGKILHTGKRLYGSDRDYGELLSYHLIEQADFMPYRDRILAERRAAWIGS